MTIVPVQYAESVLPEKFCFINGSENKVCDIVFQVHLIKTGKRNILVDAGCETMPGFVMRNFYGTVKSLKNKGIFPEDITDVVITHSHHDHIECVKYFKNAIIHIEKAEYDRGKKYIPDDFKLNIFENKFILCNGVEIIKIGGHTEGSCVVEVRNADKHYVIAGDECYLRKCIDKKIPTGSSFNQNASRAFIEKYSAEKYIVLLSHDK